MNLIYIMTDTFRPDYMGCYGNSWVKTPNLDRFAEEGVLFENAYAEGLPTIPERIVHFTGKYVLPFRGWEPLRDYDITLAEILGRRGTFGVRTLGCADYLNAMFADTYHLFKQELGYPEGMNFHRGFHTFQWIRGQEIDNYVTAQGKGRSLKDYLTPKWKEMLEKNTDFPMSYFLQYHKNVEDRQSEEDYFVAKTMRAGMRWLEENCGEKFFLYLDTFDPHEPWDPPMKYYNMYRNPDYTGPVPIWATYIGKPTDFTEEETHEIKAAYAGEVSLVDHWVGELLRKVDELGLRENTLVVFTSDHGTNLGTHGLIGKGGSTRDTSRIPLVIRHPEGQRGKRIENVVWSPDIMSTVLDILRVEAPKNVNGKSFWPMVTGREERYRDFAVSGSKSKLFVVDEEWSYVCKPETEVSHGFSKVKYRGLALYSLREDPHEGRNVIWSYPKKAKEMMDRVRRYWTEIDQIHRSYTVSPFIWPCGAPFDAGPEIDWSRLDKHKNTKEDSRLRDENSYWYTLLRRG